MTALWKPDGGVRGVTMAKQMSKQAEVATAPFQHALSTKAGCECVAHNVLPHKLVCQGHGPGKFHCLGQPQARSRGGWVNPVAGCPIGSAILVSPLL